MSKYNPDVHSSVVGNLKSLWLRIYPQKANQIQLLEDAKIWEAFEEGYGVEPAEDEFEEYPELRDEVPQEAVYVIVLSEMIDRRMEGYS